MNLPLIIKIEKSSLGGYIIKKYQQLNGITKEVEIIFIKQESKCNIETFDSDDSILVVKVNSFCYFLCSTSGSKGEREPC